MAIKTYPLYVINEFNGQTWSKFTITNGITSFESLEKTLKDVYPQITVSEDSSKTCRILYFISEEERMHFRLTWC